MILFDRMDFKEYLTQSRGSRRTLECSAKSQRKNN